MRSRRSTFFTAPLLGSLAVCALLAACDRNTNNLPVPRTDVPTEQQRDERERERERAPATPPGGDSPEGSAAA